jgi:queuine tRNA-ribosyltransferase
MKHEIVRTRSGVLAMRSVDAGEIMHPGVGPLVEAQLLYVEQSRLAERLVLAGSGTTLVLFDVGMGAASNAGAAHAESERAPVAAARLEMVSFERDLDGLTAALSHPAAFGLDGATGVAARALVNDHRHETVRTTWRLEHGDLLDALAHQTCRADIVFWDPFSPRVNPDLWTVAAFTVLRHVAGPRCTLFTYSASTAVRVALLLAGWAVGVGDAIGDKAATTAAAVLPGDLTRPLDRRWLARLSLPDVPLPPDAPPDAVQRAAESEQFNTAG